MSLGLGVMRVSPMKLSSVLCLMSGSCIESLVVSLVDFWVVWIVGMLV